MKKIVGLALVFMIVLSACVVVGCSSDSGNSSEQEKDSIVLRFADPETPGTPSFEANLFFMKRIAELTDGLVKIEHYHSGQLGNDKQCVAALKVNTLDLTKSSTGNLAEFTSVMNFTDIPGMFNNAEHVYKLFNSPIRDELTKKIYDELGLYPVAFDVDGGAARIILNTQKPIHVPDDLKGMKIRTTGSPIEVALYDAWDVGATPVAWQELYTAMQQRVVDGLYAGPVPAYDTKFTEVAKYATFVDLSFGPSVRLISQEAIKKLGGIDSDYFKALLQAAREGEKLNRELLEKALQEVEGKMKEQGVTVVNPTEEQMILWRESAKSTWPQFIGKGKPISQELVDRVQALVD